jgi:hypothetical protein
MGTILSRRLLVSISLREDVPESGFEFARSVRDSEGCDRHSHKKGCGRRNGSNRKKRSDQAAVIIWSDGFDKI